ncbi:MAG TPA: hypothetical protein VF770_02980 [Solirubrobacterales bacterium]
MDDLRRLEAKGLARAKIRSRRRRVSTIRRRTVRGSLALFTVLWGIIFAQLATGNDPVLSRVKGTHTQAAASRETGKAAHSSSGAVASSTPPEPEAESELESELAPEAGAESGSETESSAEAEPPAEPEAERAPEPRSEPAPPLVTSAS